MPLAQYSNNARSTLSAGISSSATFLVLTSGGGAQFPNPTAPQYFWATLVKNGNASIFEIVLCTARSTDTVTITRAQQGTTALSWATGDYFSQYITDGDLDNFVQVTDLQAQSGNYAADSGSANAYVVALTPALTSHVVGMPITWKALNASNGASTFNDGAGAAALTVFGTGAVTTQIVSAALYTCVWDGARFQLIGFQQPPFPGPNAIEQGVGVTKSQISQFYEFLDPRRYLITGNGTTDDTAAVAIWQSVVNVTTNPTSNWPGNGFIVLCAPQPGTPSAISITAANFIWNAPGGIVRVKPDSWVATGDGTTHVNISGSGARVNGLIIDGNQSAFAGAQPIGRLFEWVGDTILTNVVAKNSPAAGVRVGNCDGWTMIGCQIAHNANTGMEIITCTNWKRVACSISYNGWGYHVYTFPVLPTSGAQFAGYGSVTRFRSYHGYSTDCLFLQNGQDGDNVNQGSYEIHRTNCIVWMNNDGGFTYANDISGSTPGSGESPYNCSEIDCTGYNNWSGGSVAYCSVNNLTRNAGCDYYNNHRCAGMIANVTSVNFGVYMAAGSEGISLYVKCSNTFQKSPITAVSVSGGSAVITATNWGTGQAYPSPEFVATIQNYPNVAFYNPAGQFEGYGTATAEISGQVTVTTTPYDSVVLANIVAGWTLTQNLQHGGGFVDNNCQGEGYVDGFNFNAGPENSPIYGLPLQSGAYANGQNFRVPNYQLDPANELLVNPSFDAGLTGWTIATPGGGSSTAYSGTSPTSTRSAGSMVITAGTSGATANASVSATALLALQGAFNEFGMWAYAVSPGDCQVNFTWILPGSGNTFTTTVNHPGSSQWIWIPVSCFIPTATIGIIPGVTVQPGKTCKFDTSYDRVRLQPVDNRSYSYPNPNLPV